ncbi:MAG: ABC transporter permease [Saprospiraceae bacterium]|nr:ABC transporter permease [Saprospiraceae bacterium]
MWFIFRLCRKMNHLFSCRCASKRHVAKSYSSYQYSLMILNKIHKIIKHRRVLAALIFLIVVACFGDWIAHTPTEGQFALVPYSASTLDNKAYFLHPNLPKYLSLYNRHWLGTDAVGRDVTAGLIMGTRTALLIGFGGMFLAFWVGVPIGLMSGFWGDDRLKRSIFSLILRGGIVFVLGFYFFIFLNFKLSALNILIKLSFVTLCYLLVIKILEFILNKIPILNRELIIPFDLVVMRVLDIVQAVPLFLWVMSAVAVSGVHELTPVSLIILIGFTHWVIFARLVRGEVMRIRSLEYMEAAVVLGVSEDQQMWRHALPNVLTPAIVALSFGIANAILLEALLSFLGIGLPVEMVSWGTLLQSARINFDAWWLAIFPGLAIFFTVYTFNRLGELIAED